MWDRHNPADRYNWQCTRIRPQAHTAKNGKTNYWLAQLVVLKSAVSIMTLLRQLQELIKQVRANNPYGTRTDQMCKLHPQKRVWLIHVVLRQRDKDRMQLLGNMALFAKHCFFWFSLMNGSHVLQICNAIGSAPQDPLFPRWTSIVCCFCFSLD